MLKNIQKYELHEETFYEQLECLKKGGLCSLIPKGGHRRKRKTCRNNHRNNHRNKSKQIRTRRARRQTSKLKQQIVRI
jgi:hypothetical protein